MNIAIIPARKGSKGVPNKNIRDLGGKPLIQYTIDQAVASGVFDEIFISSDSEEIMAIAQENKVVMPFLRPENLSGDHVPMRAVIEHVLEYYKGEGKLVNNIMLLQPTCPFRSVEDITEVKKKFEGDDLESVISVKQVPNKFNPYWVYTDNGNGEISLFCGDHEPVSRRQSLPKAYYREGSVYYFAAYNLEKYGNIYGSKIGFHEIHRDTVNIDTLDDFDEALKLIQKINNA